MAILLNEVLHTSRRVTPPAGRMAAFMTSTVRLGAQVIGGSNPGSSPTKRGTPSSLRPRDADKHRGLGRPCQSLLEHDSNTWRVDLLVVRARLNPRRLECDQRIP